MKPIRIQGDELWTEESDEFHLVASFAEVDEYLLSFGLRLETIQISEDRYFADLWSVAEETKQTRGTGHSILESTNQAIWALKNLQERSAPLLGDICKGTVSQVVNKGFLVDLEGFPGKAFLPRSHVDWHCFHVPDSLIGRTFKLKVIDFSMQDQGPIVSRKVLLKESSKKEVVWTKFEENQVVEGTITGLDEQRIFVVFEEGAGAIHLQDISWSRRRRQEYQAAFKEKYREGDKITCKVISFKNPNKMRLGIKQLTENPWLTVCDRYSAGMQVTGTVFSTEEYGAFIELEPEVEGFLHLPAPENTVTLQVGQQVTSYVQFVDAETRRVSLGEKPFLWENFVSKYPEGSTLKGRVVHVLNYGVLVNLAEGVSGLLYAPGGPALAAEDLVDVVVLSINQDARKVSLGHVA